MGGDVTGWTSTRYMPKLPLDLDAIPFDFHDLVAAAAPRPCLLAAPLHDSNFKWDSVDKVAEAAQRIYELFPGASGALRVEHPDCEHDFPSEMRELAYQLFEEHLPGSRAASARL